MVAVALRETIDLQRAEQHACMKDRCANGDLSIIELQLIDPPNGKERARHELCQMKGKQSQDHDAIVAAHDIGA